MPDTHHKFGPSSLKHREICPRWERQEGEAGEAAQEGTRLHAACETGDMARLDAEQTWCVEQCVGYVASLLASAGASLTDDLREVKLAIRDKRRVLTYGTADRLIVCEGGLAAHVVDYKFGRQSVGDAANNLQGQAYAVGAMQMFPAAKNVTVHFILPRRDEVTTHTYGADEAGKLLLRVATVIARAEDPFAAEQPDTENCLYCGRKAKCGALAATALTYAGKTDGAVLPPTWDPRQIEDPAVLAGALRAAPLLEEWCKMVRAEALARVNAGVHVPGFVLRRRSGGREVDDAAAVLRVAESMGAARPALMASARWSFTKIQDAIAAAAPHGDKGVVLAAFDEAVAPYVSSRPDTEFLQRERKAKE